jgi:hypothetical protein
MKRVCNYFVGIAREVMKDMMELDPGGVEEMWTGGHLECDRERLIESWNNNLTSNFNLKRSDTAGFIDL